MADDYLNNPPRLSMLDFEREAQALEGDDAQALRAKLDSLTSDLVVDGFPTPLELALIEALQGLNRRLAVLEERLSAAPSKEKCVKCADRDCALTALPYSRFCDRHGPYRR